MFISEDWGLESESDSDCRPDSELALAHRAWDSASGSDWVRDFPPDSDSDWATGADSASLSSSTDLLLPFQLPFHF